MAATYLSLGNLTPAINSGVLILVPNNRLRNHLLRAYATRQTAKAWLKPNIQSLSQWLESLWDNLQNNGVSYSCAKVATNLQRQIIWEAAIKNSSIGDTLLQPKPLAQQADSAFKNLELWRLTQNLSNNYFVDPKSNTAQFIEWIKEFKRALKIQNSVTREHTYELIAQAFELGHLPKLDNIYLEGFDDIPPLMQHVLEIAAHNLVRLPAQNTAQPILHRTQLDTFEDEITAAALWSFSEIQANPDKALIGIVVPNLGQSRDQVERIFTEVFEAYSILPSVARYTLPFNFSAGTPLGNTPLISSVFDILDLQQDNWPLEKVCNFLTSPFWGDESKETIVRAHLTTELRKLGRLTLSTSDLRFCLSKLETCIPEFAELDLGKQFEEMGNLLRRRFDNKSASDWLIVFDQLLSVMNWPGSRRLDSQEYQQLNQWFEVRDQFASMDNYSAHISYAQACRYLREIADKTPFQAQTPDSPIQILGALEAAGLQFSHLWVMGLNDSQWPPVPAPNPLLPLQLQREHNMPHASATRELEIAQGLTQRYKQSAANIIFSSAHRDGDNELRPSALIRDIPLIPVSQILEQKKSSLQTYYEQLQQASQLDLIHDSNGPELQPEEPVRGGSQLFKLQASCPFEAFVRLRLGANNPDEPVLGFSPAERGNLLHESLAIIWQELETSNGLANLDDPALQAMISNIVKEIVSKTHARNPRKLGKVYCDIEHNRLTQLLTEWLISERDRPSFKVIAIEQESDIEFAGLRLKLRVDRIDEFSNGDRLIIDYKTGNAHSKSWQGDRITEPQLPLYAVTQGNISAISFAQINRKQQKWDGLGELHDTSLNQPGVKLSDDWQHQLQEWHTQLQKLADDFVSGDARVDFKDKTVESYATDLIPLTRSPDADALQLIAAKGDRV